MCVIGRETALMQTGHPHSLLAIAAMTYNHVKDVMAMGNDCKEISGTQTMPAVPP